MGRWGPGASGPWWRRSSRRAGRSWKRSHGRAWKHGGCRWRRDRIGERGNRRHRQSQRRAALVFLERDLTAFHRNQHPALMVLPGLEAHHVVGRLIEEDPKTFLIARDHPDEHERRLLR